MENNEHKSIFDEFIVDETAKANLTEISRWANVNAIVGFVSLGVSLLSLVLLSVKASEYGMGTQVAGKGVLNLLITGVVSLLLNITLLQAAANIKKGVQNTDQGAFTLGVTKMAVYFKTVGIITIIALILVGLGFLFGVMAGASQL
jgi:hypothetical protein